MKTKLNFVALALMGLVVSSAGAQTVVTEKDYAMPKCKAPVASVVIGKITCKSANCQNRQAISGSANSQLLMIALQNQGGQASFPDVGEGMAAMLTTVLKETGCFDIQEREAIDELSKELALVGKKVEVQAADFMISGSITGINMSTEKTSIGGGLIPILGLFETTKKTADISMDMKIIDVNRAKVLESRTFVANNETSSYNFGAVAFGGLGLAGGGMSSVKGTPMEAIVRDILVRVASFTSTKLVAARGDIPAVVTRFIATPVAEPMAEVAPNSSK